MGYCPEPTPEMGEYTVEVRRESFYLVGEDNATDCGPKPCPPGCDVVDEHRHGSIWKNLKKRHGIHVYPVSDDVGQGGIELLIEDIPKIRAALDQVERVEAGSKE